MTAGLVLTARWRSVSARPLAETGESNWTMTGMPTPTVEPVLGSRWYVAVTLAASVVKWLVTVLPPTAAAAVAV